MAEIVRARPGVPTRPAAAPAAPVASQVLTRERVIPATPSLRGLLPAGGLQRGSTVTVGPGQAGSTTLALELLAGISVAGHFCAAVGLANLGVAAAAEHGIALDRLLLVASPGPSGRWQHTVTSLLDGVAAVLLAPAAPVRPSDARKLASRARERGSILLVLDRERRWREPVDLRFTVTSSAWSGLGSGHGLLEEQSIEIEVSGRGAASRPRQSVLRLGA